MYINGAKRRCRSNILLLQSLDSLPIWPGKMAKIEMERNGNWMNKVWKKYAAVVLAGMISFSAGISTQAAPLDDTVNSVAQPGASWRGMADMVQPGAAGTGQEIQPEDMERETQQDVAGQGALPEGSGQDAQPGDAGNVPSDGTDQGTQTDGTEAQPEDAGQEAGTGEERPAVNANISENPEVNADVNENKPEVSADITPADEDDDHVVITEKDKPYLALGANLNDEQRNTVLRLMGVDPANLDQYQVVTVTNEEEHQYLDEYLDASIIGTRALSSVVIVKRDKGEGIHISTKNISYCTVGMYKNALATAGLEDADVIIAGPFPLSGTAALIGAMKAYADMEEEEIDTESLDAAMNEIVVTGELNESLGDDVQTEEFIAYVKQKVVEGGLESKEKIQQVLAEACDKFEISLSDSEKERITALMQKIGSLDINVDSLLEQAGSIYDSLKDTESSSGILSKIAAFFRELLEAIINFFSRE